jgi:hypothetical protein
MDGLWLYCCVYTVLYTGLHLFSILVFTLSKHPDDRDRAVKNLLFGVLPLPVFLRALGYL